MDASMRELGWGEIVVLAAAGFLGGFTFLFATDFALLDRPWCINEETHCVREWLGALSGWVAGFGAFATVFYLRRQLVEQQRATDSLIGDTDPTIAVTGSAPGECYISIINWNRRDIEIIRFRAFSNDGRAITLKGGPRRDEFGNFQAPLRLAGHISSSDGPIREVFSVLLFDPREDDSYLVSEEVRIEADIRIIGETVRTLTLKFEGPLNVFTFSPPD